MAARYRQSYTGVGEMLRSDMVFVDMVRRAHAIKDQAERTAPVYDQGQHPGRYRDSFDIDAERRGGSKNDRGRATVSNDAPEALAVEFGNANTPRHATLRRAARRAGGG
jgi:hypothetical protein